jgi:hypothetical protein
VVLHSFLRVVRELFREYKTSTSDVAATIPHLSSDP